MSKLSPEDYGPHWDSIRYAVYQFYGYKCLMCGMEFIPGTTTARTARRKDGQPYRLTIHHLDRDHTNHDWGNLVPLCQACHLHVQAKWRPGWPLPPEWKTVPPFIRILRLPYLKQLSLFGDDQQ